MGTSEFPEQMPECQAEALVFSGRPNPTWTVAEGVVKKLEEIWRSLAPALPEMPPPPPLGYRGCLLRCGPDLEWLAYKGTVMRKTGTKREYRQDADREFEKLLLGSAPPGSLPAFDL